MLREKGKATSDSSLTLSKLNMDLFFEEYAYEVRGKQVSLSFKLLKANYLIQVLSELL